MDTLTQQQLVTMAEFETYIARPEHRERRFELFDGVIVKKCQRLSMDYFLFEGLYESLLVHERHESRTPLSTA